MQDSGTMLGRKLLSSFLQGIASVSLWMSAHHASLIPHFAVYMDALGYFFSGVKFLLPMTLEEKGAGILLPLLFCCILDSLLAWYRGPLGTACARRGLREALNCLIDRVSATFKGSPWTVLILLMTDLAFNIRSFKLLFSPLSPVVLSLFTETAMNSANCWVCFYDLLVRNWIWKHETFIQGSRTARRLLQVSALTILCCIRWLRLWNQCWEVSLAPVEDL